MNEISRVSACPRMLRLLPPAGTADLETPCMEPRIFQLDARFESAGAWSGVAQLIKTAYLELLDIGATNIFEQHDYELHMLLPAYRDRIQPRYLCLTDTTGAGERTRFYAMERAYRQVHGLVGMVLAWKQALRDHDRWIVVVRNFDHAQHLAKRFFIELARRAASHGISVIAETAQDLSLTLAMTTVPAASWIAKLPPLAALPGIDEETARILEREIAEGPATVLEQQYPSLMNYYRSNNGGLAAARIALKVLGLYNRRGYYHEAKSFIDTILPYLDDLVGTDEIKRMTAVSEMNSCLVASGDGERAHQLVREYAEPFLTRPDMRAQMNYILAMHQLRYVEARNLALAEHHILQAVSDIRSAEEGPDGDRQPFMRAFIDNGLALLRVRQGRQQEALDLCKNAYASVTAALGDERHLLHRSVLQFNTAQVYAQMGRLEEALEHYDHAISMDPYYTEYYLEVGNILQQLDRHQDAIQAYTKAITFSPPYPEVYFGKAICHARQEQWQDALNCSGIGLELNPVQPEIRAARAEMMTELGQMEEAIAEYDCGVALDPDSIPMRVNRAVLHYNTGSFELALADMNHVIGLDPQEAAHYENRAAIYEAMNQHDLHQRDLAIAERHTEAA